MIEHHAPIAACLDVLLFDLGRVIIDIDTDRVKKRWTELAGVDADHIDLLNFARINESEIFCRHERGEATNSEFFDFLRRELGFSLSDDQLIDGWNSIFIGEMPGVRGLLTRIQGKLPIYALSNTNPIHQMYWTRHFSYLLSPFRKIYVSNELGARKPEAAAFRAVIDDIGVAPHRVMFFDDNAENVAGASRLGIRAFQVSGVADIERVIQQVIK